MTNDPRGAEPWQTPSAPQSCHGSATPFISPIAGLSALNKGCYHFTGMSEETKDKLTTPANRTTRPAAFWMRFGAHLIDLSALQALVWLIFGLMLPVFEGNLPKEFNELGLSEFAPSTLFLGALVVTALVICFLYFLILEASPLKASVGKFIFGLQVVKQNVRVAAFSNIAIRNFARMLCISTAGLGYLLAAVTRNRQGLHDLIGRTIVVAYPYPSMVRQMLTLLAIALFLIVSWHLPLIETNLLSTKQPTLLNNKNDVDSVAGAALPLGYLSYPSKTIELSSVYGRMDSIRIRQHNTDARRLTRIRLAFFEEELTDEDRQLLHFEKDFFKDAQKVLGKRAVVVVSVGYPEELLICDNSRLELLNVSFNPALIPHASLQTNSLIHRLKPSEAILNGTVFTACRPDLSDSSNFSLRLQSNFPAIYEAPEIYLNIDASSIINTERAARKVELRQLPGALALWFPGKERIELGLFNYEISPIVAARILAKKTFIDPDLPAPAALIELNHRAEGKAFTRDLVRSYQITFFKQASGPLAFPDGRDRLAVAFSSGDIPDLLSGRMQTGERLIGRISGQKRLESERSFYIFDWNLPFNAPVLIAE